MRVLVGRIFEIRLQSEKNGFFVNFLPFFQLFNAFCLLFALFEQKNLQKIDFFHFEALSQKSARPKHGFGPIDAFPSLVGHGKTCCSLYLCRAEAKKH